MVVNLALIFVSIILSLIYMIHMRWNINSMAQELDKGMVSPSDFCLMGTEIWQDEDDHYDKEEMEKVITS